MANFTYKQTKTKSMKLVGTLDVNSGTILIDDEAKDLNVMLQDFHGRDVEIKIGFKEEEILDEPAGFEIDDEYDDEELADEI